MLIKSITLKDFRQFKGEQEIIKFATEEEKNVTFILGENRSGKTTVAQAFKWCFYGVADFEKNPKEVLCILTEKEMLDGNESIVKVVVELTSEGVDYSITRTQKYKKVTQKTTFEASVLQMSKKVNGNTEILKTDEAIEKIKEILPEALLSYFFFAGEKIEEMSKEIRNGKSEKFRHAVESLTGYGALKRVLEYLRGYPDTKSKYSVLGKYNQKLAYAPSLETEAVLHKKNEVERRITEIEKEHNEIETQNSDLNEKIDEFKNKLRDNESSEKIARERDSLNATIERNQGRFNSKSSEIFQEFHVKGKDTLAQPFIKKGLEIIKNAPNIDMGIPSIHQMTIDYLLERGQCLCKSDIAPDSEIYNHLCEVRKGLPPESLGSIMGEFKGRCEGEIKNDSTLLNKIESLLKERNEIENEMRKERDALLKVEDELNKMRDVSHFQKELKTSQEKLNQNEERKTELNKEIGKLEAELQNLEKQLTAFNLRNEDNKKIEIYKKYANEAFDFVKKLYEEQGAEIREELTRNINEIFKSIFESEMELLLDEKYNVAIKESLTSDSIANYDTSASEGVAIVIAFIVAIIKMQRTKREKKVSSYVEAYPLVMDAPLSTFDSKRIEALCKTLPSIAKQIIIFTKDTEGDVAYEHLKERIGQQYTFNKQSETETYIKEIR